MRLLPEKADVPFSTSPFHLPFPAHTKKAARMGGFRPGRPGEVDEARTRNLRRDRAVL